MFALHMQLAQYLCCFNVKVRKDKRRERKKEKKTNYKYVCVGLLDTVLLKHIRIETYTSD